MENYLYFYADAKGRMVEVPLRRGKGDSAFIDAVSFTFHESSLGQFVADDEYIEQASFRLWQIFGFGIHKQAKGHGNRFYDRCYIMGDEDTMYGRVHHGGQNETILVEILGTGCLYGGVIAFAPEPENKKMAETITRCRFQPFVHAKKFASGFSEKWSKMINFLVRNGYELDRND